MKRPRNIKPGAERSPIRPDVVRVLNVSTPSALLPFLIEAMPDQKRTTAKSFWHMIR